MTFTLKDIIQKAVKGPLSELDAMAAFEEIMNGKASEGQVAGLLMILKLRGESVTEIKAATKIMLKKCRKVSTPKNSIDIVGTGGDGMNTLNISTATSIVVAATSVPVAKHGNRNISSQSGAADVLEKLGINTFVEPSLVEKCISEVNIGFMMAPIHHPAVKNVMPIRKMLGVRTIFNILGPLTNPAQVKYHLIGAYDVSLLQPMAQTLQQLGSKRAWFVHGDDGIDEISISGPTKIISLQEGELSEFEIEPGDAGLSAHPLSKIKGGSPSKNARHILSLFDGEKSPYRDAVLLNSSAALIISGKAKNLKSGVEIAAEAIDNGSAKRTLNSLAKLTSGN